MRRGVGAAVTALCCVTAAVPGPAAAGADALVVATVRRPTPVAAGGGLAAWSAYDATTGRYALQTWDDGARAVKTVVVRERAAPFDAAVGGDGRTLFFSRCARESAGVPGTPGWRLERGCALRRADARTGAERRLDVHRPAGAVDVLPAARESHLAFVRRRAGAKAASIMLTTTRGGTPRTLARIPLVTLQDGPTGLALTDKGIVYTEQRALKGVTGFTRLVAVSWGGRRRILDQIRSGGMVLRALTPPSVIGTTTVSYARNEYSTGLAGTFATIATTAPPGTKPTTTPAPAWATSTAVLRGRLVYVTERLPLVQACTQPPDTTGCQIVVAGHVTE
jgi:hypothetical protein